MTLLRSRPFWVLLISGILGFRLGMVVYPSWQVAVEAAQVVAGVVQYPRPTPFYIYETKLWTILHQISAVFLLSGVSEIALSRLLSGVMGMVSLQALSMFVYALSGNAPLSAGASVFVLATRSASNGVTYPILLMATEHTYGSIGLSTLVLSVSSLAAGCFGLGGFLVGIVPAVHPSWGLFLWLLIAACAAWDLRAALAFLRPASRGFAAGVAVTFLSAAFHLLFTYDVPKVDPAEAAKYLDAFVSFWDGHRAPVELLHLGVVVSELVFALGLIWVVGFRDQLAPGAVFLLRFVTLAAATGLAMSAASWIPPAYLPSFVVTLMPSRLLNIGGMIVVPLLIGLLGMQLNRVAAWSLLLALLAGLAVSNRSMLWEWQPAAPFGWLQNGFSPLLVMELTAAGLAALAANEFVRRRQQPAGEGPPTSGSAVIRIALAAGCAVVVMVIAFLPLRLRPDFSGYFRDRTNDPFFGAVAAEHDGLVLSAGSYSMVQLLTRRPVLLAGALDTLTYAPETGPEIQRILVDIYGVDLLNPPEGAQEKGVLPRWIHKDHWERTAADRWAELRRAYDVRTVLTPADWTLQLPISADNGTFRLYRIPG